ncbi:MAG: AAA family ATPase [Bacteroidales bacterium]|nr:AAA family ATPase [Bacteroidales bacterium]
MKIEKITIKNFKVFKDAVFDDLGSMTVLVGANGTGKSTFFDMLGFLKDALFHNVSVALSKRGGYKEVISRGVSGNIEFEIKFREPSGKLATYFLAIGLENNKPIVLREILKFRRGSGGQPWHFLDFTKGEGEAITNEDNYDNIKFVDIKREQQTLTSPDTLAIKGLGQFKKFKVVNAFREMIEKWHVSDFHISAARNVQDDGYAEHLSEEGDNLPLVTKYIYEHHPDIFNIILHKMSVRVPGISQVEAKPMEDGRLVLKFKDGTFKDPFVARYVSDGTIKMFAYLILLHDPTPHNLLCIEEPENQLYPELMAQLSEEFRQYGDRGGQIFVTTHSPDFLNGVNLDEIFWLEKANGFSGIHKAGNYPELVKLIKEGDKPGYLWKQKLFKGINL